MTSDAGAPAAMMTPPQRIGVLTFHRCINYGSYWQARCLVDGLRGRGHDAVLLDHRAPEITWAEWRNALQPHRPEPTAAAERRVYGAKTRMFLRAFEGLPQSRPFPLADPASMDRQDVVVVGSDEVWNLSHPWYGGRPIFYGAGLPADRIVSYAASFGNYDAAGGLHEYWQERLRGFSALSVRDENSRMLVREATGKDPAMVLDPVLQFPPVVATPIETGAPYLAVYGHSLPAWFGERVRAYARAAGYRLVSIGYRNDWADEQRLVAGPVEFAELIAGAAAVATNFFHGCVFALVNGKPFACAPSPYRFNKVRDLTTLVGASRHLVAPDLPAPAYAQLLGQPLDAAIGATIGRLRTGSARFLDGVLA